MPPKTRRTPYQRDDAGRFLKKCGSIIHQDVEGRTHLYNILQGKKLRTSTIKYLIENNIISKNTKYICHYCVGQVENTSNSKNSTGNNCDESLSTSTDKLPDANTTEDSLLSRCIHICSSLDNIIRKDVALLYNQTDKCSMESLLSYNPGKWLAERPPELVYLLQSLCGFNSDSNKYDHSFQLAKVVEYIYGCRNSKLVLPLSFQENILIYSLSRSKNLVSYSSKLNPSGSYEYISKWMSDQASEPINVPSGLLRSVFDNEQIIGKRHKVRAVNKIPMSIVTSHIYISINPENDLQKEEKYSPQNWLFEKPVQEQIQYFLEDTALSLNLFYQSRNKFISDRLAAVIEDHGDTYRDYIDDIIDKKKQSALEKTCLQCGAENDNKSRKCSNCRGPLKREPPDIEQYFVNKTKCHPYSHFTDIGIHENIMSVKTGEPDLCNPNSFENISTILFNMGHRAGLQQYGGNERQWLFMECDGGIYSVIDKLIFNVYRCNRCAESFYGHDEFLEHGCSVLHSANSTHEFGWVLLMPGLLHIEINACKSFFEINWDIFLKDVCSRLGYSTPKALDFAKRCLDHHKSWAVLEILYTAFSDELLVPFVRHCKISHLDCTVDNYWVWSNNIVNPNYLYMQQMVFTFLHSLMLFRIGCRKGNPEAIVAGRNKLSLLFYARHHPRYQRIMALNRYLEAVMPVEIREVIHSSYTLSRIGNTGHYQGGDACLEEINKEAKAWMKQIGVPTEAEWTKIFRNLDSMNKIKENLLHMSNGTSNGSKCNNEKINVKTETSTSIDQAEIVPVRELIRENGYLMNVTSDVPHCSLNGEKLSHQLVNFTTEAEELEKSYKVAFLTGEDNKSNNVIYITEKEMNEQCKLENNTKDEIYRQILLKLEEMEDEGKLMGELFKKTVKGKTKQTYVNFYYSLFEN